MTDRRGRMPLLHRARLIRGVLGFALTASFIVSVRAPVHAQVMLRDLVQVEGMRSNQLVGYGLVMGLQNTGDTLRNNAFTQQSLNGMLERMGVNVSDQRLQTRNTAAVVVTATLPAYTHQGQTIDVQVASLGDAKSLQGGTLMVTPLMGADGEVYAVSQGEVVVGGITAAGQAQAVREGTTTGGRIPNGGIVEREIANHLDQQDLVRLSLRTPDFTTAMRIEAAVNSAIGAGSATAVDPGTIDLHVPPRYANRVMAMMSQVEQLRIASDIPAKVVIDEKSGTIVVGADVRLDTVAVTHGNLTVTVTETPQVSQPGPFSGGQTVVVPRTQIDINRHPDANFHMINHNANLRDLVDGLNALGLGPRDMIQVLGALKASGALHAELQVI